MVIFRSGAEVWFVRPPFRFYIGSSADIIVDSASPYTPFNTVSVHICMSASTLLSGPCQFGLVRSMGYPIYSELYKSVCCVRYL